MSETKRERVVVFLNTSDREVADRIFRKKKLKYQGLLEALFTDWLQREVSGNGVELPTIAKKKTIYDELLEIDPRAAESIVHNIKFLIKQAKETKIEPPQNIIKAESAASEAGENGPASNHPGKTKRIARQAGH